MKPRPRSPQLAALAEHLADPYGSDAPQGVRVDVGTRGPDFWDHMADLMAPPPRREPPPPHAPPPVELQPGERAGPTLVELAQARSSGLSAGDTWEAPERAIARQEAQRAERDARFPGWPWNEGGGVVHVYS